MAPTNDAFRIDKRGHGTFEMMMRGLRLLEASQGWVGVKMTAMPETASRLFDNVKGLAGLGVNQFLIGHATGIDWPAPAIQVYGEQLRLVHGWYMEHKGPKLKIAEFDESGETRAYFGCQAGRNSIAVSVDGEISPCSKVLALDNKKLLAKLGDVRHGLTHIRNRSQLVSCSSLTAACQTKGIAADYQGGCFASNYSASKDLYEPNIQDHEFSILNRSICSGCSSSTYPPVKLIMPPPTHCLRRDGTRHFLQTPPEPFDIEIVRVSAASRLLRVGSSHCFLEPPFQGIRISVEITGDVANRFPKCKVRSLLAYQLHGL